MKNLKKIVRTDAAFDILDSSNCAGGDWGAGGCAILASALNKLDGYPMYVIYNVDFDGVEHFGVMTPSGSILDHDGEHRNTDAWLLHFKEFEHPRSGKLIVVPWGDKILKLGGVKFDEEASERLAELIKKYSVIRETVRSVLREHVNESALRVDDLPNTAALFIREINQGFDITLYDPSTKVIYGTLTTVWRDDSGREYYVGGVAANKGFGPFIYELAMMRASQDGKGLMPTRDGDIREDAWNIWSKFFDRTDVAKKTLLPDSPYFKFDILFSEDDFESEEEKQEWLKGADSNELRTLNVFNSVYYLNKNNEYNTLVSRAKEYVGKGFDEQNAIDAAEKLWYDSYK